MQLRQLGGPDRDRHHPDEQHRRDSRAEAEEQHEPPAEFYERDEQRLCVRRRDAQRTEELRDVVEAVELAPPGRDEHDPDRQANDPRPEPFEPVQPAERAIAGDLERSEHEGLLVGFAPAVSENRDPLRGIYGAGEAASVNENVLPRPRVLSAQSFPPCASTMDLAM